MKRWDTTEQEYLINIIPKNRDVKQRMFYKMKTKGLILGFITGLFATFFDSQFITGLKSYVPYSYPFVLIVFNVLFWSIVGSISGLLCSLFLKEEQRRGKENFYWVLFYLMPFSIIYGVLGRIPVPQATMLEESHNTVYDHHMSFIWVALILCFLLYYFAKNENKEPSQPLLFSLEIIIVMTIFQFCSIPEYYIANYITIINRFNLKLEHYLIHFYIAGVLGIYGFYFLSFFKIRPVVKKFLLKYKYNYALIAVLFFMVCGFLYRSFLVSQKNIQPANDSVSPVPAHQQEKKISQIVLIVLDALRADHLSVYNNKTFRSKNLEMLSQDSVVFEQCIAPSSWTLPSHASLFTGLYVSEHKCEYLVGWPALSNNYKTLAEILRENGYKTAAVISNFGWLNPKFNIHRGFQTYNCIPNIGGQRRLAYRPLLVAFSYLTNIYLKSILGYRPAVDINKEAISILNKIHTVPFFLFLNYMDTHTPYRPPRPYDNIFLNKTFTQFYRLKQYFLRSIEQHDKSSWDSYLQSQYDGEIAYLDYELGNLFAHLKQLGIYDSSLIIVTSDHGDLLGEHGLYEHHGELYEGVTKVPLIIKFPFSKKNGKVKKPINLTDVFPTILSICDIPIPSNISGEAYGGSFSPVSELYSYYIGEHKAIYVGKYKYMEYSYIQGQVNKEKKSPELYDLEKDPHEEENLAEKSPELVSAMHAKLQNWKNTRKQNQTVPINDGPLSEDIKENLRALGYVQ